MDRLPTPEVREQLARILESAVFAKSGRMRQFLEFIVSESLAGREETIKESVIARQVYGRSADFDAGNDPIVRVDARRLRDKLREYYSEHPADPLLIDLPKGRYAPSITRNVTSDDGASGSRGPHRHRRVLVLLAASLAAVIFLGQYFYRSSPEPTGPADSTTPARGDTRAEPLTSYVGHELHPSFSPDGSQVAFAWNGDSESSDFDIYVKVVGEDRALQLTGSSENDYYPAWSPDGSRIAFVRKTDDETSAIYAISPLGGQERLLIEGGHDVSWGPDSSSIVFSSNAGVDYRSIFRLQLATRDIEQLTYPGNAESDYQGALAPDGRSLAFIRCATPARHNCDVRVADVAAPDRAWRLTRFDLPLTSLTWASDSHDLVVSVMGDLYRIEVRPDGAAVRLGLEGSHPVMSGQGDAVRLAFQQYRGGTSIWRTPIVADESGEPQDLGESQLFIDSTRGEGNPLVSPDGETIVFASDRGSREWAAWAADADGENPRLLSEHINGQFNWSPDGSQLAGLCIDKDEDRNDICVVDVKTGHSTVFARSPDVEGMPVWAPNGNELYFTSDRSGTPEIWMAALPGDEPTQLTDNGAIGVAMSYDRTALYFYPDASLSTENWAQPLMAMSIADGTVEQVLERVYPAAQVDAASGIYWLDFVAGRHVPPTVRHLSRTTETSRDLGRLSLPVAGRFPELAIHPDETFLYTAHSQQGDTDIVVVHGFR